MKQLKQLRKGNATNNAPDPFRGELKNILINEIEEIQNVRTEYPEESISELARSIERHGLMHPIVVIKHRTDEETDRTIYRVIAGHRRLKAHRLLLSQDKPTYSHIKAIVREHIGDIETNQLIENVHREDLTPADLEQAVKSIMQREGLKQTELAERIGKKKDWVSKILTAGEIREDVKSCVDATPGGDIEKIPSSTLNEFSRIKDKPTRNKAITSALKNGPLTQKKARETAQRETGKATPAPSVKPSETAQKAPYEAGKQKTGGSKGGEKHAEILNAVFDIVETLDAHSLIKYLNLTTGEGLKQLKGTDRAKAIDDIKKIIKKLSKV